MGRGRHQASFQGVPTTLAGRVRTLSHQCIAPDRHVGARQTSHVSSMREGTRRGQGRWPTDLPSTNPQNMSWHGGSSSKQPLQQRYMQPMGRTLDDLDCMRYSPVVHAVRSVSYGDPQSAGLLEHRRADIMKAARRGDSEDALGGQEKVRPRAVCTGPKYRCSACPTLSIIIPCAMTKVFMNSNRQTSYLSCSERMTETPSCPPRKSRRKFATSSHRYASTPHWSSGP